MGWRSGDRWSWRVLLLQWHPDAAPGAGSRIPWHEVFAGVALVQGHAVDQDGSGEGVAPMMRSSSRCARARNWFLLTVTVGENQPPPEGSDYSHVAHALGSGVD
jgi:hypothetical protein